MSALRLAIAQINVTVGDLEGNAARIAERAARAQAGGARLLLTPELSLTGYSPEDRLLRPDFQMACERMLSMLATRIGDIAVVVGHPQVSDGRLYNAASVLRKGRIETTYHKQLLPNFDVFDEMRYFSAGERSCVFDVDGVRCGLIICADLWEPGPAEAARTAGAELLLVPNASPYHLRKQDMRHELLCERLCAVGLPMAYANLVGGQDELLFDGGSFAMDAQGRLTHQLPQFEEALEFVDYADGHLLPGRLLPALSVEAEAWAALVLGVRDYVTKNGFPGVLVGLSGGLDSALVLAIAADALGADRVRAVMMPSPYTAQISRDDARALAAALGVRYDEMPIASAMQVLAGLLMAQLGDPAKRHPADTTEENLQARIRGLLLMALSNHSGALVLTTGNKSEMAVGYATLYGDMAGGLAVLKDVYKTFAYRLARHRNAIAPVIPRRILTRAPSAELKPDQTDQDALPPYDILDAIVEAFMERDLAPREIIAQGYAEADVKKVIGLLRRNEYKRRQSPPGIRVTRRAFGKDWRYPITAQYGNEG